MMWCQLPAKGSQAMKAGLRKPECNRELQLRVSTSVPSITKHSFGDTPPKFDKGYIENSHHSNKIPWFQTINFGIQTFNFWGVTSSAVLGRPPTRIAKSLAVTFAWSFFGHNKNGPSSKKHCWILLMEEILHHLGYINLVNNGINYQPQLVSRISEPSTVLYYVVYSCIHCMAGGLSLWHYLRCSILFYPCEYQMFSHISAINSTTQFKSHPCNWWVYSGCMVFKNPSQGNLLGH